MDLSFQLDYAIYFPALFPPYAETAIGGAADYRPMPGDLEPKDLDFFNPGSKLFYLPAALYSAGLIGDFANPKPSMVTNRQRADTAVLGDSGGFQIISGNLHVSNDHDRYQIFSWQENQCDIAMTLDIPTAAIAKEESNYISFEQCLTGTLVHLKSYERFYQRSDLKLLNVLQGRNGEEADIWYDAVKHYDFDGWAFAGPLKTDLYEVMRRILIMLDEGKLGGKRHWLHFLGVGKLKTAALMTVLRDALRERLNNDDIVISLDTSSPILAAGKFKTAYDDVVLSRSKFGLSKQTLPINDPTYVGSPEPFWFPTSPIGKLLTMGDLIVKDDIHTNSRWDGLSAQMLANHNVYIQMKGIKAANEALSKTRAENMYQVPGAIYDAKEAIQEILGSSDPWAVLEKRRHILERV